MAEPQVDVELFCIRCWTFHPGGHSRRSLFDSARSYRDAIRTLGAALDAPQGDKPRFHALGRFVFPLLVRFSCFQIFARIPAFFFPGLMDDPLGRDFPFVVRRHRNSDRCANSWQEGSPADLQDRIRRGVSVQLPFRGCMHRDEIFRKIDRRASSPHPIGKPGEGTAVMASSRGKG